jgi:hypothetical protein
VFFEALAIQLYTRLIAKLAFSAAFATIPSAASCTCATFADYFAWRVWARIVKMDVLETYERPNVQVLRSDAGAPSMLLHRQEIIQGQ